MNREAALIAKQGRLHPRLHQADCPDKFRAIAEWWWLSSMMSRTREEHRETARAQQAIARDMERRPGHYRIKPTGKSAFQWSQVGPTPSPKSCGVGR